MRKKIVENHEREDFQYSQFSLANRIYSSHSTRARFNLATSSLTSFKCHALEEAKKVSMEIFHSKKFPCWQKRGEI